MLKVGLRICAVTVLALSVAFHLHLVLVRILPSALACEVIYWTSFLFFGVVLMLSGGNGPWSWTQIPDSFAYLATIVLLATAGWIIVRSRQGYPIRLFGWAPRIQPKRLAWALALTGIIYPVVMAIISYPESYYPNPLDRLADAILGILLLTVPPFLSGGILAWLVGVPKTVWLAGLLGFLTWPSAIVTLYCKMYEDSWYPLFMAITGILVATGIVAFGYALRSSFRNGTEARPRINSASEERY